MPSPLVIRNVHVGKAPGFSRRSFPSVEGLRPGLNIVWGANSVGKTTLAQCMRELLWASRESAYEAEADVEVEGAHWKLVRDGITLRQTGGLGSRTSEGLWGGVEDSERYFFQLHQLLKNDDREAKFQDYIRNKMRGGVDLEKACLALGGTTKALDGRAAALDMCSKAERAYTDQKALQEGQRNLRMEVEAKRAERDAARAAGKELKELEKILDLKRATEKVIAAQAAVDAFPQGVVSLMADDPERLTELERRKAELLNAIAADQSSIKRLSEDLAHLDVPEALLSGESLKQSLRKLNEAIPILQGRCVDADKILQEAQAAEASWRNEFKWLFPEPPEEATLSGAVRMLGDLASESELLRCRLEVAKLRTTELGAVEALNGNDTVEHWAGLQACLVNWQLHASITGGQAEPKAVPAWLRHLAVGLSAAIVILAASLSISHGSAWGFLALLAPVVVWACLNLSPSGPGREVGEAEVRAEEERARAKGLLVGFPELIPADWTLPSVLNLQTQVARRIGQVRLHEERVKAIRDASTSAAKAQDDYSDWLKRWNSAAADLRLQPGNPLLERALFFNFGEGLKAWLDRLEKVRVATRSLERAILMRDESEALLQDLLITHTDSVSGDFAGDLTDITGSILEGCEKGLRLAEKISDLNDQIDTRQSVELKAASEDISAFWEKRGFHAPDREGLVDLAGRVDAYRIKVAELEARRSEEQALLDEAEPALVTLAETRDRASLESEIQAMQEIADTLETRTSAFTTLSDKYGSLLDGDALAKARSEKVRLAVIRDQALQENAVARVIQLLVTTLKEKSQREEQPQVLNRASGWLQKFTQNRYGLGFDPDKGYFGYDLKAQKRFDLEALSSGTRVQLLFAIRLAFIEEVEGQSVNMPIFLDEVLATSDDVRAKAMVDAILEIAKDRQVFYFTAQLDEVEKLKLSAGNAGYNEVPLDDLEAARARALHPLVPVVIHRKVLPEPEADYDSYGKACGASGAVLFDPIESHHSWHLFNRSEDLHEVLVRGFQAIGQVLASQPVGEVRIRRTVNLMKRAQILARQGRGRLFHEKDLLDSVLFARSGKAKYHSLLVEEARKADGNGYRFRDSLSGVKGLREEGRATVEAWLEEQEFICPGNALDTDEILNRLQLEFPWLHVESQEILIVERFVLATAKSPGSRLKNLES